MVHGMSKPSLNKVDQQVYGRVLASSKIVRTMSHAHWFLYGGLRWKQSFDGLRIKSINERGLFGLEKRIDVSDRKRLTKFFWNSVIT